MNNERTWGFDGHLGSDCGLDVELESDPLSSLTSDKGIEEDREGREIREPPEERGKEHQAEKEIWMRSPCLTKESQSGTEQAKPTKNNKMRRHAPFVELSYWRLPSMEGKPTRSCHASITMRIANIVEAERWGDRTRGKDTGRALHG
jgi:hypothetical protein